ncbi:hypothetical protein MTsPCn5_18120 [Croceitalea sp. MTPC5]|nr:hypothetical protein MTsPCn5_18120 [Croceitalea sp. MTPC5]
MYLVVKESPKVRTKKDAREHLSYSVPLLELCDGLGKVFLGEIL